MLELAASTASRPPVALLAYRPADPRRRRLLPVRLLVARVGGHPPRPPERGVAADDRPPRRLQPGRETPTSAVPPYRSSAPTRWRRSRRPPATTTRERWWEDVVEHRGHDGPATRAPLLADPGPGPDEGPGGGGTSTRHRLFEAITEAVGALRPDAGREGDRRGGEAGGGDAPGDQARRAGGPRADRRRLRRLARCRR